MARGCERVCAARPIASLAGAAAGAGAGAGAAAAALGDGVAAEHYFGEPDDADRAAQGGGGGVCGGARHRRSDARAASARLPARTRPRRIGRAARPRRREHTESARTHEVAAARVPARPAVRATTLHVGADSAAHPLARAARHAAAARPSACRAARGDTHEHRQNPDQTLHFVLPSPRFVAGANI